MQNLTVAGNTLTMSSREMAELTGKRHDNVWRTIESLHGKGLIGLPQFEEVPNEGPGPLLVKQYRVGKRDSFVIVAQLSPEFTARLVDRWQELEAVVAKPLIPQTLPEALRLAADLAEQNSHLQLVVAEQAPKIEALDRIATAEGSLCITDAAKSLQIRRKDLIAILQARRWIYRRTGSTHYVAYQDKIQSGLMEHKYTTVQRPDKSEKTTEQARVTPKGLIRLATLIREAA